MSFPKLHDAVLHYVTIDWERAVAEISLGTWKSKMQIVAKDLTAVNCPRRLPWGPSVYVNSVAQTERHDGEAVEIEMQSGDIIVIEAKSFSLVETPET